MRVSHSVFVAMLVAPYAHLQADVLYNVTDLGTLGGTYSEGYGVSDKGQVTGFSMTTEGTGTVHAFLYANGQMIDLTPQATAFSSGRGINSAGQVAGYTDGHAFLYTQGQMADLGTLSTVPSQAIGINSHGDITGQVFVNGTFTAFVYSNGQISYLGYPAQFGAGINNSGQVTGGFTVVGNGFLYTNGQLLDIGSIGVGSSPFAANDGGEVVGFSQLINGPFHAFLYTNGQTLDLGSRNLRWQNVDLFNRVATIRRSKTAAGHRTIPLNGDAMAALARLLERARSLNSSQPEHYVFPSCENMIIMPSRPQKSWRTAWHKLVRENRTAGGPGNGARNAQIKSESARCDLGMEAGCGSVSWLAVPRSTASGHNRNSRSGRVRHDTDGRGGSYVPSHAGTLQSRPDGPETVCSG